MKKAKIEGKKDGLKCQRTPEAIGLWPLVTCCCILGILIS